MRACEGSPIRRIATVAALSVIAALSAVACSGAPASVAASRSPVRPQDSRPSTAWGFTVRGVNPVIANGSQDTNARAAGATCDGAQLAADRSLGNQIAAGFAAGNFPAAASLLRHFLAGTGTGVSYPAGSRISRLAGASSAFQDMDRRVQAAIARQLHAGGTQVQLSAGQLPTVTFSEATSDLYWSFRGTQGLTVSGSGSRKGERYVGTLTYVIADSYGFPVGDTLGGFGPPMRYLQTVCGAPQHAGGARWFPDTVTVTVPFDQPA
jgi:hypothetical protein